MHTSTPQQLHYRGEVYKLYVEAAEGDPSQLEELRIFLYKARRAFNRLIRENGAAAELQRQVAEKYPEQEKARAYWTSNALAQPAIKRFVKRFNLTGDKQKFLLSKLSNAVFGKERARVWDSLRRYLEPAFIAGKREEARKPALETGIPKEILEKLFPKSYMFDVAPDGRIAREFEVFGNERKTIEAKRKAMSILLEKWNMLVETLNKDLQSTDPIRRLEALVTSVIVNTGIRPGERGEAKLKDDFGKIVRDDEGRPIRIQTVGATGIRSEHVDFVRDDFAVIEFPGKAGTRNVAELTDPILIKALQAQVESSGTAKDGPVFVTPEGQRVTPKRINAYLRRVLGKGVTASDFRKLKATQTFYSSLKNRKHELAAALKRLKIFAKDDMRKQVTSVVIEHLFEAAEDAQEAISHTDLETTIEYYISPRVALDYLSSKGINKALDVVVGEGRELQVGFDPIDFFLTVTKESTEKTAAVQRTAKTMFYFGDEFVDYNVDDAIEEFEEDKPA